MVKTQGRHGEVAAEIHSDIPGRFAEGMRLFALPRLASVEAESPRRQELDLESFWPHKEFLVLKFRGVDSISQAEGLVGCELQIPRSERGELEPGWSFVSDLAGCTVFDRGRAIGRIEDVQFGAGEAPLLIVAGVDGSGKKFEIPFAEAYLETVDIAHKQVRMNLPEGLLDVTAPVTEEEKREMQPASGSQIRARKHESRRKRQD